MEAFGELPEMNKDEFAENKMKAYLHMYNKPLSPQAIATIRALAGVDRMAKLDLAKMGYSEDPGCSSLDHVST